MTKKTKRIGMEINVETGEITEVELPDIEVIEEVIDESPTV